MPLLTSVASVFGVALRLCVDKKLKSFFLSMPNIFSVRYIFLRYPDFLWEENSNIKASSCKYIKTYGRSRLWSFVADFYLKNHWVNRTVCRRSWELERIFSCRSGNFQCFKRFRFPFFMKRILAIISPFEIEFRQFLFKIIHFRLGSSTHSQNFTSQNLTWVKS